MQIRPYAPQYLDSLCQLINAADQVDRANLGTSRESLSLLVASTDPEDIQLAFQSDQLVGYARLEWGDAESTRVGCCGIILVLGGREWARRWCKGRCSAPNRSGRVAHLRSSYRSGTVYKAWNSW